MGVVLNSRQLEKVNQMNWFTLQVQDIPAGCHPKGRNAVEDPAAAGLTPCPIPGGAAVNSEDREGHSPPVSCRVAGRPSDRQTCHCRSAFSYYRQTATTTDDEAGQWSVFLMTLSTCGASGRPCHPAPSGQQSSPVDGRRD